MKILLFGRTGQVAAEILRRAEGELIVEALDRRTVDLTDPAACAARIVGSDADVVINAAAYTAVDRAESEEALAALVNGESPGAMAQACAARGIPFLHVSTDYVFNGQPGRAWREDDPVGPLGAYGRTKLAGEAAVAAAGGPHVILRTAWVFAGHGQNFVRTMLRVGATRDRLTVVDDQLGCPTPADAIADALLTIARAFTEGRGVSGIFHFAGNPPVTWCGFARAVFAQAAALGVAAAPPRPPEITGIATEDWATPAARPRNSVLDCSRIATAFGIAPPDWRAGLDRVLTGLDAPEP